MENLASPSSHYFAMLQKAWNTAKGTAKKHFAVFRIVRHTIKKKNTAKFRKTHGKGCGHSKIQKNTRQRTRTRQRATPRVLSSRS
jgi:hypothetical protein